MLYGRPHPIHITDSNIDLANRLTVEQIEAVCQRDMLLARELGLSFDDYMSLIV